MEVIPGVRVEAAALALAEVKMQPVVCYLFYRLPTPRRVFTEWAGAASRKGDPESPVLETIPIPAHTFRQS